MSMNTYPLQETGLVITGELACAIFLQQYQTDEAAADCGEFSDYDVYDILEGVNADVLYCSEFEGVATPLKNLGDTEDRDIEFQDDMLVYMPCDHQPSLFSAVYSSFEELVEEYRQKLADAGFTIDRSMIEDHICKINGTYYC